MLIRLMGKDEKAEAQYTSGAIKCIFDDVLSSPSAWAASNVAWLYENNYSFRINYNVTLTAVYGEEVTPEPVIRITKVARDPSSMKLTFYAERSVPETYTVVSHGMLMGTGTNVSDTQMTVGSAKDSATSTVRKAYGTSNELNGTFSLAKAKVSAATVVVARPFIIVKNASGEQFVVYGDIVRTSNNATD